MVPGLKYFPGMSYWEPATRDIEFYKNFEDVPEKWHTTVRPQMFPPENEEEAHKLGLNKCLRILPHLQDSGAFFVAVLVKKRNLPWEKECKLLPKPETSSVSIENKTDDNVKTAAWGPQRKKRKLGFKEDPFVFFKDDDKDVWESIKNFYEIDDSFNPKCLLTRSFSDRKKNIYFCSEQIRELVINNEHAVKIINTGVKVFARCDNKNMKCAFRLAQEGLPTTNSFIKEARRIHLEKNDLIILLQNTDPTKPPAHTELTESTQKRVENVAPGSCVLHYDDKDNLSLTLVGWRGTHSLRAYIDTSETIHMLRLLGADLSKYGKLNLI